jgi:hypothetical protein
MGDEAMKDTVNERDTVRVLGPQKAHYWLVQRMAKATGVDLVRAMDEGVIDHADWAGIVTHCRGCQWTGGCQEWLGRRVEEDRPVPGDCENRERFLRMRAALEQGLENAEEISGETGIEIKAQGAESRDTDPT